MPKRQAISAISVRKTFLGADPRTEPAAVRNQLLAALPRAERERLLPTLDVVPMKLKALLHRPGDPIQYVYFPGGGFCSLVTVLTDGRMVEVATVGCEGMVGLTAAIEGRMPTATTMVQGASDTCFRMTAASFRTEMARRGPFAALMAGYADAFLAVVMQSTACNVAHSVEQRLARWLLMAHDHMGTDEFPLTQEFVAMMLGAARPTVTVIAGILQKAALITYHHGHVTIVSRTKLEAESCECYRATTQFLRAVTDR